MMGASRITKNIVLLGHSKAGKTALSRALLRVAGIENPAIDKDPESLAHQMTTTSSHFHFMWQGANTVITNTPGDDNFLHEADILAHISDNAILTICADEAHKFQTEKAARLIQQTTMPSILFINRMDEKKADFNGTLAAIRKNILLDPAVLYLPIGSGADFRGVVDVLAETALFFSKDDPSVLTEGEIPAAMQDEAFIALEKIMEQVAETDDELVEELLEEGELSQENLLNGLKNAVASGALSPVLPGAAKKGFGASLLLELAHTLFPEYARENASQRSQIFKIDHDPNMGILYYCKINSGTLTPGTLYNVSRNSKETLDTFYIPYGGSLEKTDSLTAGMIGILVDLKHSAPGDTLADSPEALPLEPLPVVARSHFTYAVACKTPTDSEAIYTALSKIMTEDPALHVSQEPKTGQTLFSGQGRLHLEVACERIARKFGIELELTLPTIPYQERQQDDQKQILLEPLMNLSITLPDDCVGEVIQDLGKRRGKIMEIRSEARNEVIVSQVPMAEILEYGSDLAHLSGGRATFKAVFSHYEKLNEEASPQNRP
jgi:elongation factor G